MPGRGGFEVLEWLKQESPPHLRRIPVVMFSSSDEQTDINRAYDLGASAYLVKPVGFDKLHTLFKTTGEFFIEHAERPTVDPG
jgi:CheY-like chemotaxis protein